VTGLLPDTRGLGRLDGSLVVLTGGTRGIGLSTAAGLAGLGAEIVLTGRDAGRGGHAVSAVAAAVPGAAVRFVPTDLSTLAGTRTAADRLRGEVERIDVLVHNAGVLHAAPLRTDEGLDVTVVVNHLAPFLLTHLLRPALGRPGSRPARVLTVTSGAARFGRVAPGRLLARDAAPAVGSGRHRAGFGLYGASKAAAALAAVEWAARSATDGTAPHRHLVDPGGADTSLVRGMTEEMGSAVGRALFALFGPGRRSPATAARSSLVGAAAPGLDDRRIRWIGARGRVGDPPRRLRDPELRAAVWARTVDLTGIDEAELPARVGPGAR
jgi:NAD(P)-dependent dehydrogenase (short-subunit alcohol dehydrogenase family)